jgi:hypothetical protein
LCRIALKDYLAAVFDLRAATAAAEAFFARAVRSSGAMLV